MNGRTDEDLIKVLEGLQVEVVAGQILKDTFERPLTKEGAQSVIDRIRARGFKIEKA